MSKDSTKVRRPWSITMKLVGLQVLAVALLCGGAYFALLRSISSDLDSDNRLALDRQVTLLREWFEDPKINAATLMEETKSPSGSHPISQLFLMRILDAHGATLLAARNPLTPPVAAFPAPGTGSVDLHVPGGQYYLVTALWIDLGSSHQRAQLQLAFDVTDDFTLIRRIRQNSSLVFALTLLAAAGLSWWIARRGLRPVAALTASAARVQASQLNARLDETNWPVELTPLVGEFDAMLGRLDGSFRRLARFSSDLSHELRTPINNLRGEAEVALNRPRTDAQYREVLESSLEEFARITRLIDTLLFIAKADHPELGLNCQLLEAAVECGAVVEFFEAASAECEVALLVRGQALIFCDPTLFRRALSNLLDNALRHTPKGGHIDLTVRAGHEGGTEVEVSDSGTGIAAAHLPHVFERFYRASENRAEPTLPVSGFGLGLAIVKSIMDLHGGKVAIASTPEQGTAITLFFPGQPGVLTS